MYYFVRDTPSAYRDGWHLGLSMSSKQEMLIQDTANCGHGNFLRPSLLKWLADDNDFSGTIRCLCARHWLSTSCVLHSDISWCSILYVCVVYVFLNKRKTARKINCHARMWQEGGLSSSFIGRFLKSVHRLFCQGGHLCSSIITSYSDSVDFFFLFSFFFSLYLLSPPLRFYSLGCEDERSSLREKKTNKNWRCVKNTEKNETESSLIVWHFRRHSLGIQIVSSLQAKKELRSGWNTNVSVGQGWVVGMRWNFSVAENYQKLSWLSRFIEV